VFRAALPVGRGVAERLRAAGDRVFAVDAGPAGMGSGRAAIPDAALRHGLDALVLPAGEERQPMARTWSAEANARVDGALREAFFCIKDIAITMTGGRIVLAAPARGEGTSPATTLIEGALVALVRLLAVELAPSGIALNALCPIASGIEPSVVADALTFLASPEASYMTGATVPLLQAARRTVAPVDGWSNPSRSASGSG
jgi:NAD(P)-dependent dehydrogenase (short-subunit alcohol dehydrogenase family)